MQLINGTNFMPLLLHLSHCRSSIGRRIGQDAAGAQQRAGECPEEASDHHRGSDPRDRGELSAFEEDEVQQRKWLLSAA